MALIVIAPDMDTEKLGNELKRLDPNLDVRIWPRIGGANEIELALVWNHPQGELMKFKNLKCIASLGAGVDHILRDSELPDGVPITRIIQSSMPQFMSEYILLGVLNYCRQLDIYKKDRIAKRWQPRMPLLARDITIGIMGLGQLGADAAVKLVPIVSSSRVAGLILRTWHKRHDRPVDAFILEGPLAGGHLGFSF